jgi:hypothetical protein
MGRRRGRTIGTILIGTFVLLAFIYALFGNRTLRTMPSPVMKAEVSQSERNLALGAIVALGASVLASDRTKVGTVSRISRRLNGRIERIRVATTSPLGLGAKTIIISDPRFSVEGDTVVLTLSVVEVESFRRDDHRRRGGIHGALLDGSHSARSRLQHLRHLVRDPQASNIALLAWLCPMVANVEPEPLVPRTIRSDCSQQRPPHLPPLQQLRQLLSLPNGPATEVPSGSEAQGTCWVNAIKNLT